MRVCVEFNFEVVGEVSAGVDTKLVFPPLPIKPGMYRFRLLGSGNSVSDYIGETDNLRSRSYHYRNPGRTQQTNIRMLGRFRSHLDNGGTVELSTVTEATVTVGGVSVPMDLSHKFHRRLLENAALVANPATELIENLA